MTSAAPIGIIGGSGLYELLDDPCQERISTSHGSPSSPVSLGEISGREVAFLTRHGTGHAVPPHLINYRANIAALAQVGVRQLITSSVVGSLRADMAPGQFVLTDQFVDRTHSRPDTFFTGPDVVHISMADPYCTHLRSCAGAALAGRGETFHGSGTAVVIQGPRFSTRAESQWFAHMGWDVLSMTQHPETVLAREQNMCVANISFVSDLDAGISGVQEDPVTAGMVWRTVAGARERITGALADTVARIAPGAECECARALADT